jgi:hypothetical protein
MDKRLLDYRPEMEFLDTPGTPAAAGGVCADELAELELSAQLLEVAGAGQLERFVGELIARAGAPGRAAAATPAGRALAAALAEAARRVLPIRHGAADGAVAPPLGRAGGDLKSRAARIFGIELEGMSPEDKEFEVAQRVVRFACDAARGALGGGGATSEAAAQAALWRAARRHAPGLLRCAAPARGHWRREGGRIVLLDV